MEIGVRRFSGATDGNRIALKQSFQITSGVGRSAPGRRSINSIRRIRCGLCPLGKRLQTNPPRLPERLHQVRTDCFLLRQLQLAQRAVIHDVPA